MKLVLDVPEISLNGLSGELGGGFAESLRGLFGPQGSAGNESERLLSKAVL